MKVMLISENLVKMRNFYDFLILGAEGLHLDGHMDNIEEDM